MSFPLRTFTSRPKIKITYTGNKSDFNLGSDLTTNFGGAGSVYPAQLEITIDTGVVFSATSTGVFGWTTGTLHADTILKLENKGRIGAKGGVGGNGGANLAGGANGGTGGTAMNLSTDIEIINGSGEIWGAGGGGGGGAGGGGSGCQAGCGAGGGGGAGNNNGIGGVPGAEPCSANKGGFGSNGTDTTGGAGGARQPSGDPNNFGGAGGNTATAGSAGGANACVPLAAGSGGAAGKAINLNGNTITWISGQSSPNVKGVVS